MYSLSKILQRSRRLSTASSRAVCAKLEESINYTEAEECVFVSLMPMYDKYKSFSRLYHTKHISPSFCVLRRALSSSTDVKSTEEEELEDVLSEPETVEAVQKGNTACENEDNSLFVSELSGDEDGTEEAQENELENSGPGEREPSKGKAYSELYKDIVASPGISISSVLDKWVEEGKELSRSEISLAMHNLRKRKLYGKALQLSEWLEANKRIEFIEPDYASRLDLIAKVRGLDKAEIYIGKIPESFRGELIYRSLLANCVLAQNVKKAEEVFNKMKDLKLPISSFACNGLLLLYIRYAKKKVPDILLFMENENLKPTRLTYKILIDAKGLNGDITGINEILKTMKDEGVEPDTEIQATLARHYAAAGLKEKAVAVLKEMEGENLEANPWVCRSLLLLYSELGSGNEVGRIWRFCEQKKPRFEECMAAIEAWGKLKKVEKAEEVVDKMSQKWGIYSSRPSHALLKVYASNKMLTKGRDLVKRMADSGSQIGPWAWDALVKLYVEAGEVEKADSILNRATQQSQMKPTFNSFIMILDQYAKRGDIHNSEKIFHKMKQAGYVARLKQYETLVLAYINAKAHAYGMMDRMKADNVFPSKPLVARVDPFRKTPLSDLLD